ncbi:alanine racemase [Victivallis vadensis]|uniref:Alanine racemase n=1 Tax=Victivallis vadensis TaxID=172901 RepID=A0A2U1B1X0_9BACT|nr:alanine racemase [Victivallis vadensis]PVY42601.1 alanine racemase [Victivallis vadensis]
MNLESRVNLEVDLKKLADNFHEIRRRVSPCRLMAVLKANAYGLGVQPVAEVVKQAGAAAFGVAEINEAVELVPLGLPVQILGNLLPDEIAPAVEYGVICPLNDLEMAKKISAEAVRQGKTATGAVTVDSGMGRLGMPAAEAAEQILAMRGLPNLKLDGIYSHFSSAFMRYDDYSLGQLASFKTLLAELKGAGLEFPNVHMAASDALNNFPDSTRPPFTLARCGINMYGYYDNEVHQSMRLAPVVELKTRLAAVRMLAAGSCIGYGRMHRLQKDTRVGTIAAGYADGLPLALSNRGYVLVNGVLCPVLGRISMDYTTISLENAPEAQPGDEVVCIGGQDGRFVSLEDWAQLKGTHVYDLLCSFGTRVRRRYVNRPVAG